MKKLLSLRASKDACFVEIGSASKNSGVNVQQQENTDNDCQKWTAISEKPKLVTKSATEAEILPLSGDVDADNAVTVQDMKTLQNQLRKKSSLNNNQSADMNHDGIVNIMI